MASGGLIANRYTVVRQLGAGGQGDVFEVFDTYENAACALKLLTRINPAAAWNEARILRHLADAHILPIRNADLASGQPYIVTELATHGTLDVRLATNGQCGLAVDEVVRLMRQACQGVARGHAVSLVHNDIKPGNLFLNAEGECLVGDFGLASLIPAGSTVTVPAGATAETAAPEVASGWGTPAATASIQSDVYSLGATAFWLLASRPPHDLSGARDLAAKMAIVSTQVPRRLREFAPHVPAYLANSIERATARAPAARFATATEFAAALGRRPRVDRIWSRTDEHAAAGHVGCWRGEPRSSGSTYVTCLEDGPSASEVTITTRHLTSSNRVSAGCRVAPKRNAAQALRAVMDRLT